MKKTIIVIILLLLPGAGFASEPDFRKVNWGMSFDEVKKNEAGKPDIDSKQGLIYTVTVGGLDTKLVYNFEDEKLSTATYDFKNTYKKSFYYVTDFDKIDEGLVKKYGEPKAKNTIWFKKIFKDSPESWGTAP
ncbi:MAG: hypothetical protein KAS32_22430, partial [Candidatus Peribacteraceae bacterium]|nr:hypothetical protein [Candidatus Peribacteraceae bacterium]